MYGTFSLYRASKPRTGEETNHQKERKVRIFMNVLLSLVVLSTPLLAADPADTEVKNVVQRFHAALDRHAVAAIGGLVSPDVVVFENGHRHDAWADVHDNHLIAEFNEQASPA